MKPNQKLRESPSSPWRRFFCFGCLSRRSARKKLEGLRPDDNREWGKSPEILTDFSTFSLKEQQLKLKKAMEEEEKASREAASVVEWVKQASARMDVSAVDELLLSEDEK
ncbi:uncharacterized protein LOC109839611 [Asparagus officinalis]|nr:uncharacterized protein LOC109839611 [Asparagus officinalis]